MLNNLSIKSKLLLSMVLPILGMIYFASVNINERYNRASESANIFNIAMLNIKISSLVHELQKERGNTSGFLSSNGTEFYKELVEQKKLTDQAVKQLKVHLNNFHSEDKRDDFYIFKKSIINEIGKLSIIRTQSRSLLLSADEAIKRYSDINNYFLDFIYSTSKNTNNTSISGVILSYSNFLFAKEKSGVERALVTKMLIDNRYYTDNKLKLSNLIMLQNNFLKQFFKLAKNSEIEKFHNSIHDQKLADEIKRMETIVLYSESEYDIEPSYWFKKITEKIDKQNIIANELSKQLISLSKKQMDDANKDMLIYNATAFTILLIAIGLFLAIMKNINP